MECLTCQRQNRKRGRHRAHQCERQIIGHNAAFSCGCPCQDLSSGMIEYLRNMPSMAIEAQIARADG